MTYGFPELRNVKIKIFYKGNSGSSAQVRRTLTGYNLTFDTKTRDWSKELLVGILSHELSHILLMHQRGLLLSGFVNIKCWLSKKQLRKEEALADLIAISRGFGKHLQAQRKFIETNNDGLEGIYMKAEEVGKCLKAKKIEEEALTFEQ